MLDHTTVGPDGCRVNGTNSTWRELYVMPNEPRRIADTAERNRLISLRVLSNGDMMQGLEVCGVLYVEGHTDISILRA